MTVRSSFSLHRTYIIFRTLGLRHLTVTKADGGEVVGMITRRDLMGFNLEEKLDKAKQNIGLFNTTAKVLVKLGQQRAGGFRGEASTSRSEEPPRAAQSEYIPKQSVIVERSDEHASSQYIIQDIIPTSDDQSTRQDTVDNSILPASSNEVLVHIPDTSAERDRADTAQPVSHPISERESSTIESPSIPRPSTNLSSSSPKPQTDLPSQLSPSNAADSQQSDTANSSEGDEPLLDLMADQ